MTDRDQPPKGKSAPQGAVGKPNAPRGGTSPMITDTTPLPRSSRAKGGTGRYVPAQRPPSSSAPSIESEPVLLSESDDPRRKPTEPSLMRRVEAIVEEDELARYPESSTDPAQDSERDWATIKQAAIQEAQASLDRGHGPPRWFIVSGIILIFLLALANAFVLLHDPGGETADQTRPSKQHAKPPDKQPAEQAGFSAAPLPAPAPSRRAERTAQEPSAKTASTEKKRKKKRRKPSEIEDMEQQAEPEAKAGRAGVESGGAERDLWLE